MVAAESVGVVASVWAWGTWSGSILKGVWQGRGRVVGRGGDVLSGCV